MQHIQLRIRSKYYHSLQIPAHAPQDRSDHVLVYAPGSPFVCIALTDTRAWSSVETNLFITDTQPCQCRVVLIRANCGDQTVYHERIAVENIFRGTETRKLREFMLRTATPRETIPRHNNAETEI